MRNIRALASWLILAIAVAAVIYLLIWYGPDVLARHDIGSVSGPQRSLRLQEARDAARGRLLTLGAGMFAIAALVFTARNYLLARQTLEVTEQRQVTDRYTKAIDQLGSDKLDVRIGGIYALGRVAFDSWKDHQAVMDVLTAFIREHSRELWPVPEPDNPNPERATRPDVQAAIDMIRYREVAYDRRPIDLARANLTGADLSEVDFSGGNLYKADLTGADLTGADLTGADLTDVLWPVQVEVPGGWRREPDSGRLRRAWP